MVLNKVYCIKQSFSTIITGYKSKPKNFLRGADPPRLHWNALHAANLSKASTLKTFTPMTRGDNLLLFRQIWQQRRSLGNYIGYVLLVLEAFINFIYNG